MKPLILIVEDNLEILTHLKMMLECRDYQVITAFNGKVGLKTLSETDDIPDLIISDINMPEMDGYEFFKEVSINPKLMHIPFVFLSALDSPANIRFGKLLGADDYLTKPINEEDLLAVITGKVLRNRRIKSVDERLQVLLSSIDSEASVDTSDGNKSNIALIQVVWDDIIGPRVESFYSEPDSLNFSIEDVGSQLYEAANTIYGRGGIGKAEGILINIENIHMTGYAFFNSVDNPKFRGGTQEYMFAVTAPSISYFHSLSIKEILSRLSEQFKKQKEWNIKDYWEKIFKVLTTSII